MIALVLVATEVPQEDQLVRSLDSFGDHLEMQAVSERDNGAKMAASSLLVATSRMNALSIFSLSSGRRRR